MNVGETVTFALDSGVWIVVGSGACFTQSSIKTPHADGRTLAQWDGDNQPAAALRVLDQAVNLVQCGRWTTSFAGRHSVPAGVIWTKPTSDHGRLTMGDGFRVDLYALERAAAGVNGTLNEVNKQQVSDIPHDSSAIGHDDLASTLSDFLDRWQRGVNHLAEDGQQIATRLTANVNAYVKVEKGLAGQFNGILQGSSADPGEH